MVRGETKENTAVTSNAAANVVSGRQPPTSAWTIEDVQESVTFGPAAILIGQDVAIRGERTDGTFDVAAVTGSLCETQARRALVLVERKAHRAVQRAIDRLAAKSSFGDGGVCACCDTGVVIREAIHAADRIEDLGTGAGSTTLPVDAAITDRAGARGHWIASLVAHAEAQTPCVGQAVGAHLWRHAARPQRAVR